MQVICFYSNSIITNFYQHMPKDFWPVNNMGDAAILYCFIFLYFVARGPGALSVDGDTRAIVASSD